MSRLQTALGAVTLVVQFHVSVVHAQSLEPETAYVRVTHYLDNGPTANGGWTFPGSTACSSNFPFGTTFVFDDGTSVVCNDRGRLFYNPNREDGWLDVYTWRRDLDGHATVQIITP